MKILIAKASDIESLTHVEIESKIQSIPDVVNDFEIDFEARCRQWKTYFNKTSPQSSKPERIVYKAMVENKIVGYISGHLTTRYDKDAKIQSFYILKEFQRTGLGITLLKKFIGWLDTKNAKSLCVGFHEKNKYQAFYLKHGGQYLNPHWIYWDDINQIFPFA